MAKNDADPDPADEMPGTLQRFAHRIDEIIQVHVTRRIIDIVEVAARRGFLRPHPCAQVVSVIRPENDVNFAIRRNLKQHIPPQALGPAAKPDELPPDPRPVIDWHMGIVFGVETDLHRIGV